MYERERLTLARLPSGVELATTVHRYGDPDDGPTLYVQAAQHGREINGTEVCRRLHDRLDPAAVTGELVVVPVADPLTFDRVSYTTPEALDSANANMNRVWPGDADGSLHERMAARLWALAGEADACVDLHTGSPDMATHTVYLRGDRESRALAEAFGVDLLLAEPAGEDADAEWASRSFDGKFRVATTRAGIPTITPELAHNTAVVESAVEAGVEGLLSVCRHCGLLPGSPDRDGTFTTARNHLGRVRAEDSGLFVLDEGAADEVGRDVEAGERFGELVDPTSYERLQVARADRDGVLYSVAREATVTAGEPLIGVAERVVDEAAQ